MRDLLSSLTDECRLWKCSSFCDKLVTNIEKNIV